MFTISIPKKIMLFAQGFFRAIKDKQNQELKVREAKDALEKFKINLKIEQNANRN